MNNDRGSNVDVETPNHDACRWAFDYMYGTWTAQCGQTVDNFRGSPFSHGIRRCPHCDGAISVIEPEECEDEDKSGSVSHPELMCTWNGCRILSGTSLGLMLGAGNCCDMEGAIRLATIILPPVEHILTYSGAIEDTSYHKSADGTWHARIAKGPIA